MDAVLSYLSCFAAWAATTIQWAAIEVFEAITTALAAVVSVIALLIPSWPNDVPKLPSQAAGILNWFIPVPWLLAYLTAFITVYAIFRIYSHFYDKAKAFTWTTKV